MARVERFCNFLSFTLSRNFVVQMTRVFYLFHVFNIGNFELRYWTGPSNPQSLLLKKETDFGGHGAKTLYV